MQFCKSFHKYLQAIFLKYMLLDIFCKYPLTKQVSAFPLHPSYDERSIT